MKKSKLSPELRAELKRYILCQKKLDEQDARVRDLMDREGVYKDSERLVEAIERLPSSYLKFTFLEQYYIMNPRKPPKKPE